MAVTSVGIDGESKDQVTGTSKPEIVLKEGSLFSTSEVFYGRRKLLSDLLEITEERTSMGRIVTARVVREGKIMLSGPASAVALRRWVEGVEKFRPDLTIVDGALSRLSSASPIVSESLILTTGAAYSADMQTLIRRTKYITELVEIEEAEEAVKEAFKDVERGVYGIDGQGRMIDFKVESSLVLDKLKENLTKECNVIYVAGALTERFLGLIASSKRVKEITVAVRDFTKIFVSEEAYRAFLKRGGRLKVLKQSKLLAVCVNPVAPNGIVLDSDVLCSKLRAALGKNIEVHDIMKENE